MRKLLVGLVAVTVAMPSFAYYWGALSGSWWDSGNWLHGGPPTGTTGDDWVCFESKDLADDVTVDLEGRDACAFYLRANNTDGSGITDNDGEYFKAVLMKGDGATMTLAQQISADFRRKLTFDNVKIDRIGDSGDVNVFGTLEFRNGSSFDFSAGSPYVSMRAAGSRLLVDDSRVRFGAMGTAKGASIEVRNGGSLDYGSCWGSAETFNAMDIRIVDGDVYSKTYPVYTTGLFPLRSGTLYCRATGVKPQVADGARIRLGGTIAATNSATMYVSITNNATIYGRGRIFTGKLEGPAGGTLKLDLASVDLGNTSGPPEAGGGFFEYLNDVKFGLWGMNMEFRSYHTFDGLTTFDTKDILSGVSRTYTANWINKGLRCGLSATGGGEMKVKLNAFKDRFALLSADTNTTFTVADSAYYTTVRTHDFVGGPGSTFSCKEGRYNWYSATGKVTIDPTMTLKRYCPASLSNDMVPVFVSIDADYPDFNIDMTIPAGCVLKRVGGCIYVYADNYAEGNYGSWKGDAATDCLWSTAANWRSAKPSATFRTRFSGMHYTVVTNDVADVVTPGMGAWKNSSGPFIIRGNAIKLTDSGAGVISYEFNVNNGPISSAVWSESAFPFIIEAPIVTEKDVFGVTAVNHTTDSSTVALMGTVTAENATFKPCGEVVVGGTVNAKDFQFVNSLAKTMNGNNGIRTSVLTIRDGGLVDIAAQTSAQSATGTLWIAKGGTMKVNGDWTWNDEANEHVVDGTLEITGSLGGDAVQGYFGKGSFKVGGAASRFRTGAGLTLVPGTGAFTGVIEFAGDTALAPEADWSLPVNAEVSGLGAKLEIAGTGYTSVSALPAGYDYDIVVSGKVAPERDLTIPHLEFKPGATVGLCLKDGAVPVLTASNNVSVAGVKFAALTEATQAALRKTPVLRVAEGCQITGTPEGATDDWKFAVRPTFDGGSELCATIRHGLTVILR